MSTTLYSPVEFENASPEVREIYEETMQMLQIPFVLNWFKYQGAHPDLLRGNWNKLKHTMLMGELPGLLKQLIIYVISQERQCTYCAHVHGIFADLMGKELQDSPDFKVTENLESQWVPHSYKVALKVVKNAALYPEKFGEADIQLLEKEGFSPTEIVELLAQADLVNMLNTQAFLSGVKIDNELMEAEV